MIIATLTLARKGPEDSAMETESKPILIGATLALSGNLAYIGEAERNGLLMAIEEVNEAGGINGRPLKLVAEDNQGDTASAVSGFTKLLNVDDVDVIFSFFTHITSAVYNLAPLDDTLLIYHSSVRDFAEESNLIFKDHVLFADQGQLAATVVLKNAYPKVALLSENGEACSEFVETFRAALSSQGQDILETEYFQSDATEVRTPLLKIKAQNPDVIAICAWRHSHIVVPELQSLGMLGIPTVQVASPFLPPGDTPEMRAIYRKNNTYSTWFALTEATTDPVELEFKRKYTERFGTKPLADSAYSYDDIHALAQALGPCTSETEVDPNCLSAELAKVKMDGAGGPLSFDEYGISTREGAIIQVNEDGLWEKVNID